MMAKMYKEICILWMEQKDAQKVIWIEKRKLYLKGFQKLIQALLLCEI
jgi:hypothetical protein